MRDVARGLEPVQRREVVADRDPLAELAQPLLVELLAQLRLSDENDLEELALIGLEVREQADLLEQLGFEILGLVDEQDDVVAGRRLVEQVLVQDLEVRGPVELARLQTQLGQHHPHHLRRR